MTDRDVLDALEQWLEAEFSRLEEIRRSPRGLTDEGEARREATEDVIDKLRELRETARLINEGDAELAAGEGKTFDSVDEMFAELDKETTNDA